MHAIDLGQSSIGVGFSLDFGMKNEVWSYK